MRWLAVGMLVQLAGLSWDGYWHSVRGMEEQGIIPPHMLWGAGVLLVLIAAVRLRGKEVVRRWIVYALIVLATAETVGFLWDNLGYHLRGVEPPPDSLPHLLNKGGFFGLLIVTVVALVDKQLGKRRSGTPRRSVDGREKAE